MLLKLVNVTWKGKQCLVACPNRYLRTRATPTAAKAPMTLATTVTVAGSVNRFLLAATLLLRVSSPRPEVSCEGKVGSMCAVAWVSNVCTNV